MANGIGARGALVPGATVRIDAARATAMLRRVESNTRGMLSEDKAGPMVVESMAEEFDELFRTGGRGRWPALARSTVEARARRWGYYRRSPAGGVSPASPVLVWSGRLRAAATDPFGSGRNDAAVRMTPNRVEFGIRVPYARYHRATRDPMKLRPEARKEIASRLAAFAISGRVTGAVA